MVGEKTKPFFGFTQPAIGFLAAIRSNAMKGQAKRRKVPGEMREVLAQNVGRMMEERYKEHPNRVLSLARDAGVSLSSVQRVLGRETGASLDTIEAIAKVFGLPPFQMLVPWGLLGKIAVMEPSQVRKLERQPLARGGARVSDRPTTRIKKGISG